MKKGNGMHSEHEERAPIKEGASLSGAIGRYRSKNRRALLISVIAHGAAALILGAVVIWSHEEAKEDAGDDVVNVSKSAPKTAPRRARPPNPKRNEVERKAFSKPTQIQTAARFAGSPSDGFYIPAGDGQGEQVLKALKEAAAPQLTVSMQARPASVSFSGQIKMETWSAGTAPISTALTTASPGLMSMVSAPRGASQGAEEFEKFKSDVRQTIQRAQKYPHFARAQEIEGKLALNILLKRDGTVAEVKIETSSGSDILDAAAVESVQRIGKLTAFPESIQAASMRLSVDVRFDLERRLDT